MHWYTVSCKYEGCTDLKSIEIPNSVTHIYTGAFSHCTGLTSVVISSSVTEINEQTFLDCKFKKLGIPDKAK